MVKHWKYSICQLLLVICIFERRKNEDLILHHCAINSLTVTPSHTTLSRKVMIAWRCKGFTESKDGNCFCSEFHYYSLDFTRVFCLSLRSFPPRDRQTKNVLYWVLRAVWPSLNSLLCLKLVSNGRSIMVEEDLTSTICKHGLTLFSSPEPLGLICNLTTWPRNDGLWGREWCSYRSCNKIYYNFFGSK